MNGTTSTIAPQQERLSAPAKTYSAKAYLLGYEDANSFFRIFHEWEGTSPGQWRTLHLATAANVGA